MTTGGTSGTTESSSGGSTTGPTTSGRHAEGGSGGSPTQIRSDRNMAGGGASETLAGGIRATVTDSPIGSPELSVRTLYSTGQGDLAPLEDDKSLVRFDYPEGSVRKLLKLTRCRSVIPFAGAGVSNGLVPTWNEMLYRVFIKLRIQAKGLAASDATYTKEGAAAFQARLKHAEVSLPTFTQMLIGKFKAAQFKKCVREVIQAGKCEDRFGLHGGPAASDETLAIAGKLDRHASLLTGPFPAIVTTNWDLLFEESWRVMASLFEMSKPREAGVPAYGDTRSAIESQDESEDRRKARDAYQRMNKLPVRHKGEYMQQR